MQVRETETDAADRRPPVAIFERRPAPRDRLRLLPPHTPPARSAQNARTEAAVRAALDELEGALSLVSHELKSPLMSLVACLHLLESKVERLASLPPDAPDVGKTLAKIRELLALADRQVEFADRLASDLVDASRIRATRLTLAPRPCDLGRVVEEVVEAQRVVSPRRIIHLDVPDHDTAVVADPTRLAQVVANFLTNALKYSPADRPVTVRVAVHGTRARVSVRDFGPGLEKTELKRVWQRFYRAPGVAAHSAAGAGLGLGLGLYIAHEIVRRHGGRVGVTSKPAHGATFWFTLPIICAAESAAERPLG